jgi:hypothetical protein
VSLISPEQCSECKCNFATLFLNAEIISVKILKLMVPFFTCFSYTVIYEVTNFHKITCKFSENYKCSNF